MDQEGTVVYFETSPSAVQLKQNASQDNISEEDLIYSDTAGQWTDSSVTEIKIKKQSSTVWSYFADMKSKLKEWLYVSSDLEADIKEKVVTHIKNSPLLTEEDFQLLHISFTNNYKNSSQQLQSKILQTNKNSTMFYVLLSSIGTAFLSAGLMLSPLLLLAVAIVALFVILLARVVRSRNLSEMTESFNDLTSYTTHFDTLLSLLSQSIRVIQETEILAQGFSRPSQTVPISRMERQSSKLQCMSLRRRVFGLCQSGVSVARGMTEILCVCYPLTEELDERHGYLAFRPLSNLHQFMSKEEEECDEVLCLKLESLKDACNLLAVQNSELLRRLALVIGFNHHNSATTLTKKKSHRHLTAVLQHLKQPLDHFKTACRDLQWSLDFHRNSLFGEPPSRKLIVKKNSCDVPLQTVADEVHCMDLKTQFTLQRIRELGEQLVKQDEVQLEHVRKELVLIQHNLEGITEHVTDNLDLLDKLEHSLADECSQQSLDDNALPVDSLETQEDDSFEQLPASEECPSDDEVVYEAYVPTTGGDEDHDKECLWDQLSEVEREQLERQQKEAKEVPLRMLKELNSVLAVRNTEKEKRRTERKKKKKLDSVTNTGHNTITAHTAAKPDTPTEMEPRTHTDREVPVDSQELFSNSMNNSLRPSLPSTAHTPTGQQAKESEVHFKTNSDDVNGGRSGLGHSAIAQAVVAAVLKNKRMVESEVFLHEAEDTSEEEET